MRQETQEGYGRQEGNPAMNRFLENKSTPLPVARLVVLAELLATLGAASLRAQGASLPGSLRCFENAARRQFESVLCMENAPEHQRQEARERLGALEPSAAKSAQLVRMT